LITVLQLFYSDVWSAEKGMKTRRIL